MRNASIDSAPARRSLRLPIPLRAAGLALILVLLAGCGGDKAQDRRGSLNGQADEALPVPEGTPGKGVTGMPDAPGPGATIAAAEPTLPEAVAVDEFGNPLPDLAQGNPEAPVDETPAAEDAVVAEDEPGAPEAVAVVRDYYAAINARNYSRAYNLWSDGGRSAGQSPEQFANGFADTSGVSVEVLRTGTIGAAAGSRYIEVPVTLTTTHDDGTVQRFVGAYTLRRAVVDGATPEQRAWRIASADLREVEP